MHLTLIITFTYVTYKKPVISMTYKKVEKPTKFDAERQAKFCECISRGLRISQAAEACGIDRYTYYEYYNTDPKFKKAVDAAEEAATDMVENALFEAAVGGDVKAQQVWLFNRRKSGWSDSKNIRLDANVNTQTEYVIRWAEQLNNDTKDEEDEDTDEGDSASDVVSAPDAGS